MTGDEETIRALQAIAISNEHRITVLETSFQNGISLLKVAVYMGLPLLGSIVLTLLFRG